MNDALARQLNELERVRRRAGRQTAIALGLIVLLGAATGGYYLMKTARSSNGPQSVPIRHRYALLRIPRNVISQSGAS